jgi:flagellar basal-body rod protein FlgB
LSVVADEDRCMPPTEAPLFRLISARLGWLGQRQVTLGQNLANADTPDYRPRDLRPADFGRLVRALRDPASGVALVRTERAHLEHAPSARIGLAAGATDSRYETTPDGNAVILEEQMAKATETALDYQLTSNLYRKYVGMMRIALGAQP